MKSLVKTIRGVAILSLLFIPPIIAGYTGDNLLAMFLALVTSIIVPFGIYQFTNYILGGEI